MHLFRQYGLYFAWLVAITATVGSLYFSEVRHFIPCTFCWYQRILMYPLVLILGIASYRQDVGIKVYSIHALLGMLTAGYHYLEQKVEGFGASALCSVGVPCSGEYINWLGFITIPFLAFVAFALISLFLWQAKNQD